MNTAYNWCFRCALPVKKRAVTGKRCFSPHSPTSREPGNQNLVCRITDSELSTISPSKKSKRERFSKEKVPLSKWERMYKRLWGKPVYQMPNGCLLTSYQPNSKQTVSMYMQVSKNKSTSVSSSYVSLCAFGFTPSSIYDTASHLCGHRRCINPDHLVFETHDINVSRMSCHRNHDDASTCIHTPPCMPHDERYDLWIKKKLLT